MFFSNAVKRARAVKEDADVALEKALIDHERVMVEKEEVQVSLHKVIRTRNGRAIESTAYLMAVKEELEEEEGEVRAVPA